MFERINMRGFSFYKLVKIGKDTVNKRKARIGGINSLGILS